MEIFGELFLTASLALFLSFLVAKLVSAALLVGDSGSSSETPAISSGEDFFEAMKFQGSEAESKVEFVDEVVEKVDCLLVEVSVDRSEIGEDVLAANDGASSEPDEARVSGVESEEGDEVSEDNDWEGIEMDERESDFAAAVKFVDDLPVDFFVGEDIQAEFYGLRKVAMVGNCIEAMPEEALELSDRVKWLAWQRLGDMPREVAMERYITLLSQNVPAWMDFHFPGKKNLEGSEEKTTHSVFAPAFSTNERDPDGKSVTESVDFAGVSDSETKATG